MIKRRLRVVAAVMLVLACVTAAAHNFHMGMADISYNERTGSTEIVHTYTGHDLTALLTEINGRQIDLGRADSEAALRRYVEQQFTVTRADGKRLPLHWIGAKVDADSVVIFQEVPKTRLSKGDRIHNAVLIDFIPSQRNTVNLQIGNATRTLIFDQKNIDQITP
ncbi:hypothetical protein GTP38_04015 [Duganella sp. FT94W]|uniref:DUF1287 domain-containing protein n=1 Tax=Duganella lactea TaxID=2692173 RepID=A0ABW9V180_9BURK|nr:hypothetical protein [Duganella lactea]